MRSRFCVGDEFVKPTTASGDRCDQGLPRLGTDRASILSRHSRGFMGELDLTPTQIRVGEVLLRKVIPDLTHTDLNTTAERWDLRRGFWPHSSIWPQFEAKEVMRLHWISAATL